MAFDLEEQEQIASLKQFWAEYGKLIVAGAVLALVAFGGVKAWRYHQATLAGEASAVFAKFEEGVRKNDVAEIRKLGGELTDKYGSTAYGPMAALVLAKSEYENGDAAAATLRLRWAIDKARDEDTAALARVRLAGIFLDEKKYDEALKLLDAPHGAGLQTLVADMRGDVLFAQGKVAEARAAYKLAIEKSLPNSSYRNVVQIKLDALGSEK
jgi:predicted negative regulator of RcsB-dependent stress response